MEQRQKEAIEREEEAKQLQRELEEAREIMAENQRRQQEALAVEESESNEAIVEGGL